MTVAELKELLADQPDSREVFLATDGEGNDFRPWTGYSEECQATLGDGDWDKEDDDAPAATPDTLVLWPS